jgi:predicted AAA+ superfamily ATPase
MDISELTSVLNDWIYWQKAPTTAVRRKAIKNVKDWPADLVWVIQGVRRCGKSTLLAQLMGHLRLDPRNCFFINFEDPRLSGHLNSGLLDQIVSAASQLRPNQDYYFFFDEIQNVKEWERWLHKKVDRPGKERFVITGSNASLLAGDLATALTGRHRTIELFPFDFEEFAVAKPGSTIEDFLAQGGFPRPLSLSDPKQLLREYFTDIIERDVRRHINARSSIALSQAAKSIFESTGSETSLRKLAKQMDSTADTLHGYVDAFISAYLVLPCPYFTFSERKRAIRPVKYYPIDLGLRDAVLSTPLPDRGKKLETTVFHELRKRHGEIFYWRGKGEVDFVRIEGTRPVPIQVTWDEPKDRHDAALSEFQSEFPNALAPELVTRATLERWLRG